MEHSFWQERWDTKNIGFHTSTAHPLLIKYIDKLNLKKDDAIFVPLCGKTLDIHWLLNQGYKVIGSELVESAVIELFEELDVTPRVTELEELKLYQAQNIDIYVGDIFKITQERLSKVNAIYDRAALVALPFEMRKDYSAHLNKITQRANQLLIVFEYDQSQMDGPPFSLTDKEVKDHYSSSYKLSLLESNNVQGGLKGQVDATEKVWLLENK